MIIVVLWKFTQDISITPQAMQEVPAWLEESAQSGGVGGGFGGGGRFGGHDARRGKVSWELFCSSFILNPCDYILTT